MEIGLNVVVKYIVQSTVTNNVYIKVCRRKAFLTKLLFPFHSPLVC